jgi:hypothetical protein
MSRLADSFKEERMSDEPVPSCLATDLLAQAQNAIEAELPSDRVHFKEAAKSDRVSKFAIAQEIPGSAENRLPLGSLYQEGFRRHIENLRTCAQPLSGRASGRGSVLSCTAATAGDSSGDTGGLIARANTSDQTATDEIAHGLFQDLLNSDMMEQHPPVSQPQFPSSVRPSPVPLDSTFAHGLPPYIPALLPQQMQPPSTPITSHPASEYVTIRDYRTGVLFPNSYLNLIRESVDPTFSHENWGDNYYFADASPLMYIEDVGSNPNLQTEKEPLHWGLQVQAMAIPWRPEEDIWKSLERTMDRLSGGNGKRERPTPSRQEKGQDLRPLTARTERRQPPPLHHQPSTQEPEQMHLPKTTHGFEWPPLVAPGPLSLPIGIPPLAESDARSDVAVTMKHPPAATRGDVSASQDDKIEMCVATAEPEDCSMGE